MDEQIDSVSTSQMVAFAGDNVRLAGQMDYPIQAQPTGGYPLIFIIQHATCNSRKGYEHYVRMATGLGIAVFRWDKRGTGSSGGGGGGSITLDTLSAYETALNQPGINKDMAFILAQNEGTLLLGETYRQFKKIQQPRGIILAGNMLDEAAIMALDAPVHVVVSKNDWNAWQIYAKGAAEAHAAKHKYRPSFYVATNTDRRLMYTNGTTFHRGAQASISHWLQQQCQISS
jgi:alpha-beta hydrolase superfamily lysophospholipase